MIYSAGFPRSAQSEINLKVQMLVTRNDRKHKPFGMIVDRTLLVRLRSVNVVKPDAGPLKHVFSSVF